jgi:hypothetical protein
MVVSMRSELAGKEVFLYRDLPYARHFPHHGDHVLRALAAAGALLVRRAEDITGVFEDKVNAMAVYASQWKVSKILPIILDDARSSDRIPGLQETYYQMLRLPGEVPPVSEISLDRPIRTAFAAELRAWLGGAGTTPRLNVFVPLPPVRWDLVLGVLRDGLPGTTLRIFALPGTIPAGSSIVSGFTPQEVPTPKQLEELQAECDHAGEWTLVLGADVNRPRNGRSSRCLVAPNAGVLFTVWREEAGSRLRRLDQLRSA